MLGSNCIQEGQPGSRVSVIISATCRRNAPAHASRNSGPSVTAVWRIFNGPEEIVAKLRQVDGLVS